MGVGCVIVDYNSQEFYNNVIGLENEREGGKRCEKCFLLRLSKTGEYAKAHGYDYFTTTLTVSPLKNAELLNNIGKVVGKDVGVEFLPSDFKKRNGYLRSIELSKEYSLYRQNYCGCEFSKNLVPN
jgi:predicted adenine nucleotide alpha hydrolase (AANH) superfamily ATPase